jgi:hypothetical protein
MSTCTPTGTVLQLVPVSYVVVVKKLSMQDAAGFRLFVNAGHAMSHCMLWMYHLLLTTVRTRAGRDAV